MTIYADPHFAHEVEARRCPEALAERADMLAEIDDLKVYAAWLEERLRVSLYVAGEARKFLPQWIDEKDPDRRDAIGWIDMTHVWTMDAMKAKWKQHHGFTPDLERGV